MILKNVHPIGASLSQAFLTGVNLIRVYLTGCASHRRASHECPSCTGRHLTGVSHRPAALIGMYLTGVYLMSVYLTGMYLMEPLVLEMALTGEVSGSMA